ncbi:hypothetical protein ACNHUS_23415 [Actinomycetes bacterium M1A6_2h]
MDNPGYDLHTAFASVTEKFASTVDSLAAIALTVVVDDYPFTIVYPRRQNAEVVATISIPLPLSQITRGAVILAASTSDAFTDVAPSAATEWGVAAGIERDRHLDAFEVAAGSDGAERTLVDLAIGVLLDRGDHRSVGEAREHLVAEAGRMRWPVAYVARHIIDGVMTTNPDAGTVDDPGGKGPL